MRREKQIPLVGLLLPALLGAVWFFLYWRAEKPGPPGDGAATAARAPRIVSRDVSWPAPPSPPGSEADSAGNTDPDPVPASPAAPFDAKEFYEPKIAELRTEELGRVRMTALYQPEEGVWVREIVLARPARELGARALEWTDEALARGDDPQQSPQRDQINEMLNQNDNYRIVSVIYRLDRDAAELEWSISVQDAAAVEASEDAAGAPFAFTGPETQQTPERGTQEYFRERYAHLVDHYQDLRTIR